MWAKMHKRGPMQVPILILDKASRKINLKISFSNDIRFGF